MNTEEKKRMLGEVLDQLAEDTSIPRNIRRGATESKEIILSGDKDLVVSLAKARTMLDDLANDPNIPLHGRTLIWNILAQIENMIEDLKHEVME